MKIMSPAELIDKYLPRKRLATVSPFGWLPHKAFRLELPTGSVLLRELQVPIGYHGRVEELVQASVAKWSAWEGASWAFRVDGSDRALIHVAIWSDGELRSWLDRFPLAQEIAINGIVLVRRPTRLHRLEILFRNVSLVSALFCVNLVGYSYHLGSTSLAEANRFRVEVRELLPALNGSGDAALVMSLLDRKLSGAKPLTDMQTLTNSLPDGAWLLRLEWQADRIRASGLAGSVDGLLEAIQGDGQLGAVSFSAPVSKNDAGYYRFSVEVVRAP